MTVLELPSWKIYRLVSFILGEHNTFNHHNQEITPMAFPPPRSASQKLAIIIETSSLNEQDLSEYCRKTRLFTTDIDDWKANFIKSTKNQSTVNKEDKAQLKQLGIDTKSLKKELYRKEKALAGATALLVVSLYGAMKL
jgi:hypothetical protein